VALVTSAAGAIGRNLPRAARYGALVAAADRQDALDDLVTELGARFAERLLGVPIDVANAASVAGRSAPSATWGGVDLVVVNAGVAHVAGLTGSASTRSSASRG
jgi:NADP-dependent 3-hydroxy acid dehydrogenase YdfG